MEQENLLYESAENVEENESDAPDVHLEVFDGPLALLLHLISKKKIDIYDVPIYTITQQYLDYLKQWDELNMDIASEFILMAATLINIKARHLLPDAWKSDEGAEDEEYLRAHLIEYKRFQDAGHTLEAHMAEESLLILLGKGENLQGERPETSPEELLEDVKIEYLKELFDRQEHSKKESFDVRRAGFKSVKPERYTVTEKINYFREQLKTMDKISFEKLREGADSKEETITYFMAMLELSHSNVIRMSQRKMFGDITVSRKKEEESHVVE